MKLLILLALLGVTVSCNPSRGDGGASAPADAGQATRGPKVITIAILREPISFHRDLT